MTENAADPPSQYNTGLSAESAADEQNQNCMLLNQHETSSPQLNMYMLVFKQVKNNDNGSNLVDESKQFNQLCDVAKRGMPQAA